MNVFYSAAVSSWWTNECPRGILVGVFIQDYSILSIKRWGRLFKTRRRTPGVYSGLGIYLLNAFFSHEFFNISTGGLLNQEPKF